MATLFIGVKFLISSKINLDPNLNHISRIRNQDVCERETRWEPKYKVVKHKIKRNVHFQGRWGDI